MKVSLLALGVASLGAVNAFMVPTGPVAAPTKFGRQNVVQMGFFDSLKKGFENEPQSTPAANAGLKNGPTMVKITFQPQNKVVEAVVGQNLRDVAAAARIPIKYNCKKGECGTCTVTLNGRKIKTCVSIVPRGERKNECIIKVP